MYQCAPTICMAVDRRLAMMGVMVAERLGADSIDIHSLAAAIMADLVQVT